jgi:ABC-type branched-subunit amino acid transport system permease subunit
MALLAVYAYDFYKRKQYEDLKGAILLLAINILLGLGGTVSLTAHFSWALAGYAYAWYMDKHAHKHFRFTR